MRLWQWLVAQLDISGELNRFSPVYMGLSGVVMGLAFIGLYFHYTQQDNQLLGIAAIVTVLMSLYERYVMQVVKSANLTLLSAVIYSLLML